MTIRDNVQAVAPAADRTVAHHPPARGHRFLHGRAAGVAMGGELSRFHGPHRRHLRHRKDLRPRHCPRCKARLPPSPLDPAFQGGNYTAEPKAGIAATSLIWLGWLYSQEWWRRELWRGDNPPGTTLQQAIDRYTREFFDGADANNLILQMRTWGSPTTSAKRRRSLATWRLRCAPSRRPCSICRLRPTCIFPWRMRNRKRGSFRTARSCRFLRCGGHPAGAGASPDDEAFLNRHIGVFMGAP